MLKIYGRATSVNVQKALWTLGELALPYERIDVGGQYGGLQSPEFLAMNPHSRIPTIDDDGVVVWESNAIVRYLAARHGVGRLWIEDPGERAQADQWMDWMQTTLAPDFYDLFWQTVRIPKAQQRAAAIADAAGRALRHYELLDRQLAGRDFLLGAGFTLADIPAGVTLRRYFAALDEGGLARPSLPGLEAWYRRLQARPAYRQHVLTSYEPLRGRT